MTPSDKSPIPAMPNVEDSQAPSRARVIERLKRDILDMLVVGGGIVGAGVARDAAMRGLRVALVESKDFAFGTSSRSSRLLHGGLRYLAQGRIRLVREASVEKLVIHQIAPHLAQPLPFLFPTRAGTEWKHWKLRIGVKLYDLLCGRRNFGASTSLSRQQTLAQLPGLKADGLTGAVRYFDALTNDARLVIDTLRSAQAHGADLLNYCGLRKASRDADVWTCELAPDGADHLAVRTRVVINAAGAWADQFPASRAKLRLTKGVHLVIPASRLPVPSAVVLTEGSRILFAIPWGERVILGTTDTDFDGDRDAPLCDAADVDYILSIANNSFPQAKLARSDIISSWTGLRPLIDSGKGGPSDISRRHQIQMGEPGWIDVTGGKLTSYRHMAEETVDRAFSFLRRPPLRSSTASQPLLGSCSVVSGIVPPAVSRETVLGFCADEWARHLDDVMVRRSSWTHYHADDRTIAALVADWMSEALRWTPQQRDVEVARYGEIRRQMKPDGLFVSL